MPNIGQRGHGLLQAFADRQGHHGDFVGGGVKVTGTSVHFDGYMALVHHLGAQVEHAAVGTQNSHVTSSMAFLARLVQLVCDGKCFFAQRGQLDDEGASPSRPQLKGFTKGMPSSSWSSEVNKSPAMRLAVYNTCLVLW